MRANKILKISLVIFSLTISSCTTEPGIIDSPTPVSSATDYTKPEHWLNLPSSTDKAVDVFYLYPTSWQRVDSTEPYICAIDNPMMLKYSKLAYIRQATAFEPIANVYAPLYRQDDAAYVLSLPFSEQEKVVMGTPKTDVFAAFDYYIKNYNNGRPFILAGHSQGSNVMVYLLSEYMKANPQVYARMIAAYAIGWSVTTDYLAQNPHLKFAEGPDDTGVIVSFNTQAPEVSPPGDPVVLPGALAINPITWTRDETLATADKNLGSLTLNKDGSVAEGLITPVMNYADARVDKAKGVVICSTADVNKLSPGNATFGKGVYHSFDFSFYYYNIKENAARRTAKYLSK